MNTRDCVLCTDTLELNSDNFPESFAIKGTFGNICLHCLFNEANKHNIATSDHPYVIYRRVRKALGLTEHMGKKFNKYDIDYLVNKKVQEALKGLGIKNKPFENTNNQLSIETRKEMLKPFVISWVSAQSNGKKENWKIQVMVEGSSVPVFIESVYGVSQDRILYIIEKAERMKAVLFDEKFGKIRK